MRDGTGQRRAGVTPGFISGPTLGNASAWDTMVQGVKRIEAVTDAIQVGRERAGKAILEETGHALEEVVKGLIPGLLLMLVTLVATTVIGGAIGAAVGFLAGGVGAAPGAVVGADLGFSAGMSILTWLGLGFLAVSIAQGFGEMIGAISVGTTRAWDAPDSPHPRAEIEKAGDEYAHAVALLFKFILMAIVLRLAGPASKALIEQLRKSRLGEGFANWVMLNREALLNNPKLRPKSKAVVSEKPVAQAATPSQLKKGSTPTVRSGSGNKANSAGGAAKDSPLVLAGHGGHTPADGHVTVPPNTSFTVYAEHGATISDPLGNAVERGQIPNSVFSKTYVAGESVPNYTLYPGPDLTIEASSTTVTRPTLLSDLLKPDMGEVHWAACTSADGLPASSWMYDIGGVIDTSHPDPGFWSWITVY